MLKGLKWVIHVMVANAPPDGRNSGAVARWFVLICLVSGVSCLEALGYL